MTLFFKLELNHATDLQLKSSFINSEQKSVVIDETNLLENLKNINIPFPGSLDDNVLISFQKALQNYIAMSHQDFLAKYSQLPVSKKVNITDFLDVEFEELFKIPVFVKQANTNEIMKLLSSGAIQSATQWLENKNAVQVIKAPLFLTLNTLNKTLDPGRVIEYENNEEFEDSDDTDDIFYIFIPPNFEDDNSHTSYLEAIDDYYSVGQNVQVYSVNSAAGVLSNDIVSPSQSLMVTQVNGNSMNVGILIILPSGAWLQQNSDGSFDYYPIILVNGQSDDYTYTVSTGESSNLTSQAIVHINITLPIIFDLTGNGFSFVSLKDSIVSWEMDDQQNYIMAWCTPEHGVLVYDQNHNGLVDGTREFSFSAFHPDANTDLDGLRLAFDSDHNGILNSNDLHFNDFGLWIDLNRNGESDLGELFTLRDLGIESITLASDGQLKIIEDTIQFGIGTYQTSTGEGHFADCAFRVAPESLIPREPLELFNLSIPEMSL